MEIVILRCCGIAVSIFEVWLYYELLFCTVLEKEYLTTGEKVTAWGNIVVVGTLLAVNRNILFFSGAMFIICVIVTSICAWSIKKKNLGVIVAVVLFSYSFVALLDFFFAFLSMIFLQQDFKQTVFQHAISLCQIGIFACSRTIWAVFVLLVRKKNAIVKISPGDYKIILLFISVVGCVIVRQYQFVVYDMTYGLREMRGGEVGFSLLIAIVMLVALSVVLLKYQIVSKENKLLSLQENMTARKDEEVSKILEKRKILFHDIRNHYIVLKKLAQEGNIEKIDEYLQGLAGEIIEVDEREWTGNKMIDLVLNQKKVQAEQKDVRFHIDAAPIPEISLYDSEISTLFGNLLDNAIEACEKIEGEDRWIEVKLKKQKRLLFIEISNSINETPIRKKNKWVSSKSNREAHGYGLKSVERIVNKNDAAIQYEVKERSFQVTITFFDVVTGISN